MFDELYKDIFEEHDVSGVHSDFQINGYYDPSRVTSRPPWLTVQKKSNYDNRSPEEGSRDKSRNVIKYTSNIGEFPT